MVHVDEIAVKDDVLDEEVVVTKVNEPDVSVEVVDYSKMTIKELRDILSKKGITSNNKMKKTELLTLIETGAQDTLNLSEELNEVNI
jgi:predicted HTH domain antitoxin